MLKPPAIESLRHALAGLRHPRTTAAWEALGPLGELAGGEHDVVIDMRATDQLGTPVIVATPRTPEGTLLAALTTRRRQVAELVIAGLPNKAIARALGITPGTVKDHVHATLTTLGLPSRAALIAAALTGRDSG